MWRYIMLGYPDMDVHQAEYYHRQLVRYEHPLYGYRIGMIEDTMLDYQSTCKVIYTVVMMEWVDTGYREYVHNGGHLRTRVFGSDILGAINNVAIR